MIKIGLLGVGHLGTIHLRLLKEVKEFEIVGIYDQDPDVASAKAAEFGVEAWADMEALIDASDAVDIVTPTLSHFPIAKMALEKGKHIFIEKPITETVEQARELIALVEAKGLKAQVGHVERFNPAFLSVRDHDIKPMFIECHRLAQWNPRGTDVSVVLDLMIHDLDIVLSLVDSPIKNIAASGVAVISDTPDITNTRIEFENGCVANLTASRISLKNMRKLRIFQKNAYLTVDFLLKKSEVFHIKDGDQAPDPDELKFEFNAGDRTKYLTFETPEILPVNSIKMELEEFAKAIATDGPTPVPLQDAARALDTAYKILEKISSPIAL